MLCVMFRHIAALPLLISLGVSFTEAVCKSDEFTCFNGDCIKGSLLCNGKADCYDETDETLTNCITAKCPNGFQCDYGGCIRRSKECDGFEDCHDGSDESYCTTTGTKRDECSLPGDRNSTIYQKKDRAGWVILDSGVVVISTVIRVICQIGYGLQQEGDNPICGPRGIWTPSPAKCIECGRRKDKKNRVERAVELLIKKASVSKSLYPWHVAIYNISKAGYEDPYICGGSILSKKAILTAAHCVIDMTPGQLSISTGRSRSNWASTSIYQQNFKVRRIIPHYGYSTFTHEHDIAILIVNDMTFNEATMPVCIDWTLEYWNRIKSIGIRETFMQAIGWGETENFSTSVELREAKLSYYDNADCRKHIANHANEFDSDFIEKITQDKFCVGLLNGTYLYKGDSGGGVTYSAGSVNGEEVHFIYGIVSFTDSMNKNLTAITNVGKYRDWLRDKLR